MDPNTTSPAGVAPDRPRRARSTSPSSGISATHSASTAMARSSAGVAVATSGGSGGGPETAGLSSATGTAPGTQSLAAQLGRARAHIVVLKQAIIAERAHAATLQAQIDERDAVARVAAQRSDALQFRHDALVRRVEVLQAEVKSAASTASGGRSKSALALLTGLIGGGGAASHNAGARPRNGTAVAQHPVHGPVTADALSAAQAQLAAMTAELERSVALTERLQSALDDHDAADRARTAKLEHDRLVAASELEDERRARTAAESRILDADRVSREAEGLAARVVRLVEEVGRAEAARDDARKEQLAVVQSLTTAHQRILSDHVKGLLTTKLLDGLTESVLEKADLALAAYADFVVTYLSVAQESQLGPLTALHEVLVQRPVSLSRSSVSGRWEYAASLLGVLRKCALAPKSGDDPYALVAAATHTRRIDVGAISAGLAHVVAQVQSLAAIHTLLVPLTARLVDVLQSTDRDMTLYFNAQELCRLANATTADKTDRAASEKTAVQALDSTAQLLCALAAYLDRTIWHLKERPPADSIGTQVDPILTSHVASQFDPPAQQQESQVQTETALTGTDRGIQTDGKQQRLYRDSVLRSATAGAAVPSPWHAGPIEESLQVGENGATTSDDGADDGEAAAELAVVPGPPTPAIAQEILDIKAFYAAQVALLEQQVLVAEARAFHAMSSPATFPAGGDSVDSADAAAVDAVATDAAVPEPADGDKSDTSGAEAAHVDARVAVLETELEALRTEVQAARTAQQTAEEQARDTESSYAEQLAVMTEEMCRLQAAVEEASHAKVD
ncbi:hypothetical protein BC828DRAFT_393850 [Blastocladiella britannica]|nr:hypothetical protein BC828DRAFT_393850 [Blastocladiella britannica]